LTAYGPMLLNTGSTITSSGPVSLYAGYDAANSTYVGSANTLTLNGSVAGATVGLFAGGAINVGGSVTGTLTEMPFLASPAAPPPTLAQCIADPTLAGCSSVLPSLAQCSAAPTTAGCSVVLPTLAQCEANSTTAGCAVVLPTLAQCEANPTGAGCAVVLPTLVQCEVNSAMAGCAVVLPTLAQCESNTTAAGCTVVLPTFAQCQANTAVAGCSVVLPALAQCELSPSTPGCSSVLPPIVTQATPAILASNSYVIAINTESSNILNGNEGGISPTAPNASAGILPTNNTGATNNGSAQKMYCN